MQNFVYPEQFFKCLWWDRRAKQSQQGANL